MFDMLPKDNIYDVILDHRLPVSRETKSISEFLDTYFEEYINSLKNALLRTEQCSLRKECYDLLNEKMPIIAELCRNINKVFEYHDNGNMSLLYRHFSSMMEKIEEYLFIENIGKIGSETYKNCYRIRPGKEHYSRLDMFHIPMDKRYLIKSYRYSIPGYPCLYLSTGQELCWFECGMPKEFSCSSFCFELSDTDRVKLINFVITPSDLVSSMHLHYMNHPEDSNLIDLFIIKYLITFPLRVACSIEVLDRDIAFIEEYIFPQQLLLWIRENNCFDGIAYRTSSAIERAREWNYFNIVMPTKELENGYCKKLSKLFMVTKPIKVEIRNTIKAYNDQIERVRKFTNRLERKYYHGYSLYPYREMLSLCKTFLLLCHMLTTDSYRNAEAIYQSMDTLNLLSYLIIENKESIKEKALVGAKELFYGTDKNILSGEFDITMDDFSNNVKPILFELWNFITRINTPIDYTSYQHVM